MESTRKADANDAIVSVAITITRNEGPAYDCGRPWTYTSFQAAEEALNLWAKTAPEDGSYDKTDITLTIESGPDDGTRGPVET